MTKVLEGVIYIEIWYPPPLNKKMNVLGQLITFYVNKLFFISVTNVQYMKPMSNNYKFFP